MAAPQDSIAALVARAAEDYGFALDAEQCAALARYAALVAKWQRVVNLTGTAEPLTFARAHIVDCLALVPWLEQGALLDVGSGAGLPGVVLALADRARPITLLEPRAKRARFLTQACIELELTHVAVAQQRVEDHRPATPYRYVVTRAFSALAGFVQATRHLHAPATTLLAMTAAVPAAELAALGAAAGSVAVHALRVPGYRVRHLVSIACAGLPAAEAGA